MWSEQLPSCMQPESNNDRIKFVDLIKCALFYFCLEDKFLQEQLCNIKDDDITLKKFLDEACVAEQKRRSFQEIGVSSSHLNSSAGVSVKRWEMRKYDKYSAKSGKKWQNKFDNGVGGQGQGGATAQCTEQSSGIVHKPQQPQDQQVFKQQQQHNTGARQKKKGKCYNCDKVGHWANECRSKRTQKQSSYVKSCDVVKAPDSV